MTPNLDIRIRILLANSFHSEVPRGWAGDSHLDSKCDKLFTVGNWGCGDCHLSFVSGFYWQIRFISPRPVGDSHLDSKCDKLFTVGNWGCGDCHLCIRFRILLANSFLSKSPLASISRIGPVLHIFG
jgi:hypothetical protein